MNMIHNNGYGFGSLFGTQGGAGRLMGHGQVSASVRGGEDTSSVFAADIVSRISSTTPTQPQDADVQAPAAKDTSELADSLQRTVSYVQDRYGKEAATAVMGMMYKRIGNGEVSEKALGDGLLDSVKFIDRNFGMSEGDSFMSVLNDDLNAEMNDYFDNGLEERFFAASPGTTSLKQSFSTALATVTETVGQDAADGILSILDQAMQDSENPTEALKKALEEADALLQDKGTTPFTATLATQVNQAAAAQQPQVGMLLNIAV